MKDNQLIFAAGLGSTGSSALVDLLKEVDGFYSMDDEFRMFVDPGGIISLRDALVDNWSIFQSDVAIRNFIAMSKSINSKYKSPYISLEHKNWFGTSFSNKCDDFIGNLIELEFDGVWYGIDSLLMRKLNRFKTLRKSRFGSKRMYVGKNLSDEEFSKYVQDFIDNLVEPVLKSRGANRFCFNENLSCMFPEKILNMLPHAKMILVVRDPKDVFADSLRVKWAAIPESTEEFIKWQTLVYQGWMKVQMKVENNPALASRIMVVKFEDLIENYEDLVPKIFGFLNIDPDEHVRKKQFLLPELSGKNIGQWRGVLSKSDIDKFDHDLKFFYEYYQYK
ncbi:sulfotransferase [Vibrio sp. OPT20]|uniref:sulfotransferase n=1 Tax=Vibrio sp. OPT20 TaxID=2778642 RepID=UPI001881E2C9|nr:sulfotransferase [Vibrio sp. OPT20]MBE8564349.1 sulfotransferase [Vibrio sp. OPT20]